MKKEYLKVNGKFELLDDDSYFDEDLNERSWRRNFSTNEFSDKVHEFISNIGELRKVGSDAESEYLFVNFNVKIDENKFRAVKRKVAIAVQSADYKGAYGAFCGSGDPIVGIYDNATGEFTKK